MKSIVSLEFAHRMWSWSLTSQPIFERLRFDFNVISVGYCAWREGEVLVKDSNNVCYLSQNVGQLENSQRVMNNSLDYSKVIARLGGNKTFDVSSSRRKEYLKLLSYCFALVATNEKLFKIAKKVHNNAHLIPNGLNLNTWKFVLHEGNSDDTLKVGFVGNVSTGIKKKYKGYNLTKMACWELEFPLEEALRKKNQIPHEQMQREFYNKIDVLVLLTDGEGCSNVIMEALACGVPVITTKVAGFHGEKLIHKENVLFCKKNRKDLVLQLTELGQNRQLQRALSKNGRVFAEQYHNVEIIAEKYRAVFSDCFNYHEVSLAPKKKRKKGVAKVTVACVLKSGGPYSIEYVKRLRNMIERHMTIPYEFICLTDMDIDETICESIQLIHDQVGWWSKLELFRPGLYNTEHVLYFDLDTIILENIDDLFSPKYDFCALKPWNVKNRERGRCASGMMGWKNNGRYSFIYEEFKEKGISIGRGGDQIFISKCLAREGIRAHFFQKTFSGIYSYKRNCRDRLLPKDAKIVCFHGKPRLHDVKEKWVQENWI